jgi:tetratricopeptide (TPR) repeat protein
VRLQQEGRTTEAIEAFRSTLRLDPIRASVYVRLKEAYGRGRPGDRVVAELRRQVDRDGTDFVSWNLLGVLYAKQGRWADAVAALQRAVQIQPADVDAWTNLGWLSSELKQRERAREAFRRALTLDPAYGRAHAGLAGLYAEAGSDYDKAIEEYRLALSAEPDNPGYLYDLGWVYYRKGMTDEGLKVLTEASIRSPDDPAGRAKIGWTQLRRKEYKAAIEEFERALRAQPDYTFARFGLARALQAEGNDDAAAVEYKRAWREDNNDLYLLFLIKLYLQRHLWVVLLAVISAMGLTLVWLMRRRGLSQGFEAASGK